jgi:hypothetical protein
MKATKGISIKTIKVVTTLPRPADEVNHQQHDDEYRMVWDPNVIKTMTAYQPAPNCSLDYFSAKSPRPLKNRDCVFLRSWQSTPPGPGGEHCIIMGSVEPGGEFAPTKKFIRAISKITGHLVRPIGTL